MTLADIVGSFLVGLGLVFLAVAIVLSVAIWRLVGMFGKQLRALPTWGFVLLMIGFGFLLFVEDVGSIVVAGIGIIPAVITASAGAASIYYRVHR